MSENIMKTFEYYRGYSDGFKEGYNKALEYFKDQIVNRSTQILISAEELLFQTCNNKCYLYKTEHCKTDGLVPFDATTCKNYHDDFIERRRIWNSLMQDRY